MKPNVTRAAVNAVSGMYQDAHYGSVYFHREGADVHERQERYLERTRRYQAHASGLMGSPTDPRRRRLERWCRAGQALPGPMNARVAVGAV